jgi:hypothetical protein
MNKEKENEIDKFHKGCYNIPIMSYNERKEFLNILKERK